MNLELSDFKMLNVNKKQNFTKFETFIHTNNNKSNKYFNAKKNKKKLKWRNVSIFNYCIIF